MNKRLLKYEDLNTKQKENFKNMVVELTYHNGISRDNLIALIKDMAQENAELKARLEKAVELPCNVGDTVYRICLDEKLNWKVDPRECIKINITRFGFELFTTTERIIDDKVFLTKAEAEKALKEKGV